MRLGSTIHTVGIALLCCATLTGCDDDWWDGSYGYNPPPPNERPADAPPEGSQPVVYADVRPPPISGGTLAVSRDGTMAIAADPDRDRVLLLAFDGYALRQIELEPGDEPGRVVEDADGRAHVALRRGGAILTIELATKNIIGRRPVCSAPRGLVHEPTLDELHVVCDAGELVTLPADPNLAGINTQYLERDLRDVVLWNGALLITRFRSAEVMLVQFDGSVQQRMQPPAYRHPQSRVDFQPGVAWRMVPMPNGDAMMVYQRSRLAPIDLGAPHPYYPPQVDCGEGIVHGALSRLRPSTQPPGGPIVLHSQTGGVVGVTLPVDVAVSPDGNRVAVVGATSANVIEASTDSIETADNCSAIDSVDARVLGYGKEPIAVAYRSDGALIIQNRQPAELAVQQIVSGNFDRVVSLGGVNVSDTGHAMFHRQPDGSPHDRACASCHPEGREDGRVWNFSDGVRRTQSLAGGIGSVPLHWDGSLHNFVAFLDEVHVRRMGNQPQTTERSDALESWLANVPLPDRRSDGDAAQILRGSQLFNDQAVGCSDCHTGSNLDNTTNMDVGTNGAFQVPSLRGVSARDPFMHTGCAPTLTDRFGACGGGDEHGKTAQLDSAQIADLVAYLESL